MKLKRIKLKKLENTRDLGGFITSDGRKIKDKMLIRSGHLSNAPTDDIKKLYDDYNLRTVIDLRTEAEILEKPEKLPTCIKYIQVPLLDSSFLGIARDEYSIECWFNLFKDTSRVPEDVFSEMYELLVFGERTKKLIPNIFDILLSNDDGAVLWHCSAGKDRVGIVTILVLSALGVDRELIISDFLATNRFTAKKIIFTKVFAPLKIKEKRLRKCLAVLMSVKREYLENIFNIIDSRYENIEEFFLEQYSITSEQINELKNKFLTK